jgi:UDP-GlcNAc:undecaprenyl-phosphate GlcNAc-1-phosphate transferase
LGKRLKIIDDPTSHIHAKVVHSHPVPRGGGIPIFVTLLVGTFLFLPLTNQRVWGIILGGLLLTLVGFLDDRFEEKISPYIRLAVNILAALLVIGSGVGIPFITNPLGGVIHLDQPQFCFWAAGSAHCIWLMADLFALIWLVFLQNIVGWSSGVDGQLPGFVAVAAATLGLLSLRFTDAGQLPVIILAALTAGAYLGFLPFNWFPQKIMPGYGGKSLAGFLLGVLSILSGAKVGALMLVLGIPIIDAVLVVGKRLREGRSPVWGGHEHFHHSLLDLGWSKRQIALLYWTVSLILAFLALRLNSESKYFTMAAVVLGFGGLILWLQTWSTSSKPPGRGSG